MRHRACTCIFALALALFGCGREEAPPAVHAPEALGEGVKVHPALAADRETTYELIKGFPVRAFIEALTVNLDPEYSLDADEVMSIRFTDTGEAYSIHVRRGVAEFQVGEHPSPKHAISTTTDTWLDIMAGRRTLPGAMALGDVELDSGRLAIPSTLGFLAMFRPS